MKKKAETKAEEPGPKTGFRSAVGIDPGLATCGVAHVLRRSDLADPDAAPFELCEGRHQPCGGVFRSEAAEDTVAESNATRVRDLMYWLRLRLQSACEAGCEVVAAERYEHLRQSSSAAKLSAAHAAVVAETTRLDPRPSGQRYGSGLPAYPSAREVKRAVTGCDTATKRVVEAAVSRLVDGARGRFADMRRGKRAGDVEHLADACAVALHALGCRREVLFGYLPGEEMMRFELPPSSRDVLEPHKVDGRAVVAVGPWMRKALGLRAEPVLTWYEAFTEGAAAYMVAVLPGGVDRFWVNPKNVQRARVFLRAAARLP